MLHLAMAYTGCKQQRVAGQLAHTPCGLNARYACPSPIGLSWGNAPKARGRVAATPQTYVHSVGAALAKAKGMPRVLPAKNGFCRCVWLANP